jgi:hypothetical protein
MLPYRYFDNTSMAVIYTANTAKIKDLLPHPEMTPVELVPGRCLVAFACFEYRKPDGPPYNEVSISFLITYKQRQLPGITAAKMMLSRAISSYVWQLPVTTEQACAGGVDLFGYPKFIADIEFESDDDWLTCTMYADDKGILELKGRKLPTKRGKPIRYLTYALENDTPLLAEVLVNPVEYAESYKDSNVQLSLLFGHEISHTLVQLGLSKRALLYQYSPFNESILFPARNIG